MEKTVEITICLGSSCFSRGNKEMVSVIQDYLEEHKLKEQVKFKGGHCFGNCSNGPVIKINGQPYYGVSKIGITDILNQAFNLE
ncbi:MAG TPA: (2Fe-2S) ferredoxin domain-containing protein [Bacteroidales bacterium]|nr:(2Fe-2S) ferredoxin domain-containing protein [Bacteroidales bacterium]HOE03676.1 (2Fe-2S) ferredoxin domain-containing protein [Bacteroidales bacterium]